MLKSRPRYRGEKDLLAAGTSMQSVRLTQPNPLPIASPGPVTRKMDQDEIWPRCHFGCEITAGLPLDTTCFVVER